MCSSLRKGCLVEITFFRLFFVKIALKAEWLRLIWGIYAKFEKKTLYIILKITFIPKKQFEKPKLTSRTTSARSMKPKLLSSWIELTTPWYLTGAAGFSRRMVRATRLPLRAIVAIWKLLKKAKIKRDSRTSFNGNWLSRLKCLKLIRNG